MKKMFKYSWFLSILLVSGIFFGSCEKEYDTPPVKEIPTGNLLTISNLRAMHADTGKLDTIRFTEDYSVYAVVTMDERSGNLYKNVYVQDQTGAINLRLASSGGLYEGDSVRIYLKGTLLFAYNNLLQLDSVDVDKNIIKLGTKAVVKPKVLTITELKELDSLGIMGTYQSQLVKLENVEFIGSDYGLTYADGENQISENRTLVDCKENSIIIRTSGYANFADQVVAGGHGSVTAIVSQFRDDIQLLIRNTSEVELNGERCTYNVFHEKNFNDNSITSGGWTNYSVKGNQEWEIGTIGGTYVQISGYYNGTRYENEDWYISPAINLTLYDSVAFSFMSAQNYSGPKMQVYYSTDYSGTGDPNAASWTILSPVLSTGGFSWVNSGNLNITSPSATVAYVAFKYISTSSQAATWEVDDIQLKGR